MRLFLLAHSVLLLTPFPLLTICLPPYLIALKCSRQDVLQSSPAYKYLPRAYGAAPIRSLVCVLALYAVCRDRIRFHGLGAFSGATKWRDEAFALWYRTLKVQILRYECSTVVPSLVASAEGTILELGPGAGNHIPMFDQEKVRHIYGIETNDSFMLDLQALITLRQLEEKYTVIHAAVEDTDVLEKHGIVSGSIDTIVSMQVFCSARKPDAVAKELYRLLKPGGKLIFWEHHRSHDLVTWIVQNIWNVPWSFFLGGCNLNRDIDRIIRSAGTWENADEIEDTEQEKPWSMMPRVWGTLVKPIKM